MKRALVIFNPVAGTAEGENYVTEISNRLCGLDYRVELLATQDSEHATKFCADFAPEFDLVVAMGGDGTMSEVVEGVLKNEKRPEIGLIPTGSVNDFARGVGLFERESEEIFEIASNGRAVDMDTGWLNDISFFYVAAFGAFTSVSYRTSQSQKNAFGKLAYIAEGMKDLGNIESKHLRITTDKETFEDDYVLGIISNSNSIAGVYGINGVADYDDGLFEVTLVKAKEGGLGFITSMKDFITHKEESDAIQSFRASKILIEADEEIEWTLDGEFGGNFASANIVNDHKSIRVRMYDKTDVNITRENNQLDQ